MIFFLLLHCKHPDPISDTDTDTDSSEPELISEETVLLQSFEITGTIVDENEIPVADAMVMMGGKHDTLIYTDDMGMFSLWFEDNGLGVPAVVATKIGYRATGYEHFSEDTPVTLKIRKVLEPDNEEYVFQDPGDGVLSMEENCSHCHTSFVKDFLTSKHSTSASNPLLQHMYAGTTNVFEEETCLELGGLWKLGIKAGTRTEVYKCYLDNGVLPDLNPSCGDIDQLACDNISLIEEDKPVNFGSCANCHAPAINGKVGGRDLLEAVGIEHDLGVHCDFCHKVKDIDLTQPAGVGSRLIMGRPIEPGNNTFEWAPVFYGPLIDVPNVAMAGSFQPKFDQSVFCAGCHEHQQVPMISEENFDDDKWPKGLDIQSTYTEWENGPYNQEKTQCQFCHMPANTELNNAIDISFPEDQSITFGFPREPEDIRNHIFRGPLEGEPRLIDKALYVSINAEETESTIDASISVANIGCGHAVPTGEPMRSILLLVEGNSSCGKLSPISGTTISDTGGYILQDLIDSEIQINENILIWDEATPYAHIGNVLRFIRPTGSYMDYEGIGYFSNPDLLPEEKGIEKRPLLGEYEIIDIVDNQFVLSGEPNIEFGDIVILGDSWSTNPSDGQVSLNLSGHLGQVFSKVLVDDEGNRNVPHYRAIDIVSDNRISPGTNVVSNYVFDVPIGCTDISISATILYRPIPLSIAKVRNWEAVDYIIATSQITME
jgi:hypothetical protein